MRTAPRFPGLLNGILFASPTRAAFEFGAVPGGPPSSLEELLSTRTVGAALPGLPLLFLFLGCPRAAPFFFVLPAAGTRTLDLGVGVGPFPLHPLLPSAPGSGFDCR